MLAVQLCYRPPESTAESTAVPEALDDRLFRLSSGSFVLSHERRLAQSRSRNTSDWAQSPRCQLLIDRLNRRTNCRRNLVLLLTSSSSHARTALRLASFFDRRAGSCSISVLDSARRASSARPRHPRPSASPSAGSRRRTLGATGSRKISGCAAAHPFITCVTKPPVLNLRRGELGGSPLPLSGIPIFVWLGPTRRDFSFVSRRAGTRRWSVLIVGRWRERLPGRPHPPPFTLVEGVCPSSCRFPVAKIPRPRSRPHQADCFASSSSSMQNAGARCDGALGASGYNGECRPSLLVSLLPTDTVAMSRSHAEDDVRHAQPSPSPTTSRNSPLTADEVPTNNSRTDRPPRPMNAWLIFRTAQLRQMQEDDPGLRKSQGELSKVRLLPRGGAARVREQPPENTHPLNWLPQCADHFRNVAGRGPRGEPEHPRPSASLRPRHLRLTLPLSPAAQATLRGARQAA